MYPKFQHCTQRSDKMTRPVREILKEVKELAIEYYETTGKPLGITGEIGEFAASEIMGLELTGAAKKDMMPFDLLMVLEYKSKHDALFQ